MFEKEQENGLRRRNYAEGQEINQEAKEKAVEEAEKKMAARERAEQMLREVKSAKQQMQKIVANMQQVVKAVQAIRSQLKLVGNDIPSVDRDATVLKSLQNKMMDLKSQLSGLRQALIVEEENSLREKFPDWTDGQVEVEAVKRAEDIIATLGLNDG
ncbi:MAG TPA: hypothetical protein VJH75_01115 [Patescibacteria group bacterium]|nr:hypothetical protein [Patescibacteria group bacterium]